MPATSHLVQLAPSASRILKHPELWIGAYPWAGLHLRRQWDVLVLCAAELQPPSSAYPDVEVLHCPFDDGRLTRDEAARAEACARDVASRLLRGQRVLVTCAAGINRSALVAGLAVKRLSGLAGARVVEMIRNGRPGALANPDFERYLLGLS